jgi:hypothetical protein
MAGANPIDGFQVDASGWVLGIGVRDFSRVHYCQTGGGYYFSAGLDPREGMGY